VRSATSYSTSVVDRGHRNLSTRLSNWSKTLIDDVSLRTEVDLATFKPGKRFITVDQLANFLESHRMELPKTTTMIQEHDPRFSNLSPPLSLSSSSSSSSSSEYVRHAHLLMVKYCTPKLNRAHSHFDIPQDRTHRRAQTLDGQKQDNTDLVKISSILNSDMEDSNNNNNNSSSNNNNNNANSNNNQEEMRMGGKRRSSPDKKQKTMTSKYLSMKNLSPRSFASYSFALRGHSQDPDSSEQNNVAESENESENENGQKKKKSSGNNNNNNNNNKRPPSTSFTTASSSRNLKMTYSMFVQMLTDGQQNSAGDSKYKLKYTL